MTVVALPRISGTLDFSADTVMWINLIYLMSFVAFSMPFAKIISQYGIKKCTKVSLILLFVSVLLSFLSVNVYMLLLSRLLQGLTSASLAISIYVMIVEEFSEGTLGTALGVVSSAGYVGMLMAPSFMGFMIHIANWRVAFLVLIPIIFILLYLLHGIKKEWRTDKKPVDNIGSLVYVSAMVLFTYGVTELDQNGLIFLIMSFILLITFIKIEKRVKEPILNLNLFKNIRYVIGNYAAMATYFTTTIAITALSFHLRYVLNIEEYFIGMILIIAPIIMIGMTNIGGTLSNRYDARIISGIAMLFLFMSMSTFFFLDYLPFELILVACALQGIGNGLFSAPNNKYVLTIVDEKDLADASSVLSSSKEFGKILSTGIYALILSAFIGEQSLGPEHLDYLLIQSTNLMMFICALVTLSAAILLFYSKFKYDSRHNPEVIKIFKSIEPDFVKKRREKKKIE